MKEGYSPDLVDSALREKAIFVWSAFLDEPLYYSEEGTSETAVEQRVEDWIERRQYTDVMMEAISNSNIFRTKANNMLEFLQSFDKGKLKFWDPITFYEMLSWLYENGKLKGTCVGHLLDIVEEAKSSPVDELDIELAEAKKLVTLNLLTCIDKEAGLYGYGYCAFLGSYFKKNGIDYMTILGEDFKSLNKNQKELLKELDIYDGKKLTARGKIIKNDLCKCGIDPEKRDEEILKLAKEWRKAAKDTDENYNTAVAIVQKMPKHKRYTVFSQLSTQEMAVVEKLYGYRTGFRELRDSTANGIAYMEESAKKEYGRKISRLRAELKKLHKDITTAFKYGFTHAIV
ncbi:MAG: hypothetical protein QXD77_00990 [Candidatus Aenigmatarchaeota archaeon]